MTEMSLSGSPPDRPLPEPEASAADPQQDLRAEAIFRRAYIQTLLILMLSGSWIANLGVDWLQMGVLVLTTLVAITGVPIYAVSRRLIMAWFILTCSILIVALLRSGVPTPSDILFLIALFIAALAASGVQGRTDIAFQAFVRVMYHLCLISLVLFPLIFISKGLLIPVPDGLQQFFDGEINANRRFYTLFGLNYFVSNHGVADIWHNQSIFWEPGVLGLFAVLALVIADSIQASAREKRVLLMAALSTFAPGTYALLILYLGLRILRVSNLGVVMSALTVALFAFMALGSIPLLREIVLFVFDRDIYDDSSVFIRITDFWLPYVVALQQPLVGHTTILPYQDAMQIAIERRMNGMTNSVGAYFYRYGYVWAIGFLLWAITSFAQIGPRYGALPFIMFFGVMYGPVGFSSAFCYLIFLAPATSNAIRAANRI